MCYHPHPWHPASQDQRPRGRNGELQTEADRFHLDRTSGCSSSVPKRQMPRQSPVQEPMKPSAQHKGNISSQALHFVPV